MNLDEEFKIFALRLYIDQLDCCLFHREDIPKAVDYLTQNIGYKKEVQAQLSIPICKECAEALYSGEWILLYCINCNQSRWVNKNLTDRLYLYEDAVNNILWMDRCPECTDEDLKKKE